MTIKVVGLVTAFAASTLVLVASEAIAQGRMTGGQGTANYNVAAEMTVKGSVDDLKQGPGQGTHIMLKTLDGTLELALGPTWYQTDKKYNLAKGDQLEVIGAKSQVDGRDMLLVREIKKGSETMTFRDAKGFPKWAGRGRQ
jgi:DNA/RNA endonuclease YhcR with UshA esterase domain